jgi:hypothetical protein
MNLLCTDIFCLDSQSVYVHRLHRYPLPSPFVYICMHVCMYVCMYVRTFTYTNIHIPAPAGPPPLSSLSYFVRLRYRRSYQKKKKKKKKKKRTEENFQGKTEKKGAGNISGGGGGGGGSCNARITFPGNFPRDEVANIPHPTPFARVATPERGGGAASFSSGAYVTRRPPARIDFYTCTHTYTRTRNLSATDSETVHA